MMYVQLQSTVSASLLERPPTELAFSVIQAMFTVPRNDGRNIGVFCYLETITPQRGAPLVLALLFKQGHLKHYNF